MVRNGSPMVRNGIRKYGTKWLWYEVTVYHLKNDVVVFETLSTERGLSILNHFQSIPIYTGLL